MNRRTTILLSITLLAAFASALSACHSASPKPSAAGTASNQPNLPQAHMQTSHEAGDTLEDFQFEVNPETAELVVKKDGEKEQASLPLPRHQVSNLKKTPSRVSWHDPQAQMDISMEKKERYLEVSLTSSGAVSYEWPRIRGKSYMLPLGEGKYIPANDPVWAKFLDETPLTFIESFSMRFFAVNHNNYSIVYIAGDMFNDTIKFESQPELQMSFTHEFPAINTDKTYTFRIYVTANDPVKIAQTYRSYIQEQGQFMTLQQKEAANPNVGKLFGAPHIYLWSSKGITQDNLRWNSLLRRSDEPLFHWIAQLLDKYGEDGSGEIEQMLQEARKNGYWDAYQKRTLTAALNDVLKLPELYSPDVFPQVDGKTGAMLRKGIRSLSEQERYAVNKALLKSALGDDADPLVQWGSQASTGVLQSMHDAGVQKAWIGLPNWADGLINPALVDKANQLGYLIGPYDSYHSIQQDAGSDWNTASFADASLYETATIENQNGEKIKGFLGKGRKLNPTLSLPSVKQRVGGILQDGIAFNSWFIDCDATGEVYDDYSLSHPTTEKQDLAARLERMSYIRDDKHMVIGSEGGNDFASTTIAFAHGIETPVIQWSDPDMRTNENSPYYVGGYWSPDGGTPPRYAKTVPIKDKYKHLYTDPAYSLPLYKLVYNDSVITTHHWEWGSLKIKDEVGSRMLSELLYDVPPLYHIDETSWEKDKGLIMDHLHVWTPFHEKAVTMQMTDFRILTPDRLVQSTTFGNRLRVVANFSAKDYSDSNVTVPARTVVIEDGEHTVTYKAPAQ